MNIVLLIIQIILAALYIMAGIYKITGQAPALEASMPGISVNLIRLIGIAEALAATGLLLQLFRRKWPKLAGWAATFLAVEAFAFILYHLSHKANGPAMAMLILGLLATFLAWKKFT